MNDRLIGVMTDLHSIPTGISKQNLLKENRVADRILITINTVIDALDTMVDENNSNTIHGANGDKRLA